MPEKPRPDSPAILIVEDDDMDVEAIRRAFRKHGLSNPLHRAACGADALALLKEGGAAPVPYPYIMLIDINMPKMNGLDFLKEIRNDARLKQGIAFILTTSSRDSDIEQAYQLNVAGYFLKENIGDLAGMIHAYSQINCFPVC
jgi:CheY-like chemotaxis protein